MVSKLPFHCFYSLFDELGAIDPTLELIFLWVEVWYWVTPPVVDE
jgi:hypothetical protein